MSTQIPFNFCDSGDVLVGEDIGRLVSIFKTLGSRAVAAARYAVAEERSLGDDVKTAIALDIAQAIEDHVIESSRCLRYVCSAKRAQNVVSIVEDEAVDDALWLNHGADASQLKRMVEKRLDEKGSVRSSDFFSHKTKRPGSGRKKTPRGVTI
jgi:hypothetical protein